jgi:uncharacterized protein (TIGR03663 family)
MKKKKANAAEITAENIDIPEPAETAETNSDVRYDWVRTDWMWYVSCGLIVALAWLLRFVLLGIKPFHHDEGVNGHFLMTLFRDGTYKYDPANYHGPTLYYISLAFTKLFGLETLPVRWSVAIWGVLIVVLALFLRRYIGRIGSLFAALFLALSPGLVYISRYFIHEIFFIFLAMALAVSVAFFIEKRKPGPGSIFWMGLLLLVCFLPTSLVLASAIGKDNAPVFWLVVVIIGAVELWLIYLLIGTLLEWNEGRAIYLFLASASVSLMFATKETAFITLGTMLIACFCLWIWRRIFPPARDLPDDFQNPELTFANFRNNLGTGTERTLLIVGAVAVFIYVFVLFFSSFFSYPEGVKKAIEAYAIWTKTGSKEHVQNGMWAYVEWGREVEAPIMLLSLAGTVLAFVKPKSKFVMFAGLWAWGLFAAYTIIPYKTPWLAISFLMPMCIPAGYLVGELLSMKDKAVRALGIIIAAAATIVLSYQTYVLNFVKYDDEDQPYVYAHTKREFLDLVGQINYYAEKSGRGNQAGVQIVSPDYWPMVWYLKDYNKAFFHGRIAAADGAEMIIAKTPDQEIDVMRQYSGQYQLVGTYGLRPGVDLMLLVRRDLADK